MSKRTRNISPPTHCTVEGCDRPHRAKGFCSMHWKRNQKYGSPHTTVKTPDGSCPAFIEELLARDTYPDECITWPYQRCPKGHALVWANGQTVHAARHILELTCAKPSGKHMGLHLCSKGHEGCVNPAHLYWGTQADNTHDMVAAGRHPTQKINAEIAQRIWDAKGSGESQRAVAEANPPASVNIVNQIWNKGAWSKHITK